MNKILDIFIVGGGVNGVGIARDAAGRGLKVALVEQTDLAGATSSASTKLIHGGLRYLENYEFRLVRESLLERETLWKMAPHIITPLRFVLPHHKGLRPVFILRIGLFLYDYIGGRKLLPATKRLNLRKNAIGAPLNHALKIGFEYSDCWVDDARLVVLTALSAAIKGAQILTRTAFESAQRVDGIWHITAKDSDGLTHTFKAKTLVNAAGPWVDKVLNITGNTRKNTTTVRLVKGSHIIVPKLYTHDRAYTFQNADGRVIFSIPYEGEFTLIGTTDTPFDTDPRTPKVDASEIAYLCAAASEYFVKPIQPSDVVWTYSGVRPLYDDGEANASKATRDYVLDVNTDDGKTPLLNIYGGKITTHRCLAEEALEKLAPYLDMSSASWTAGEALPGGDLPGRENPDAALKQFIGAVAAAAPWLNIDISQRLARSYGTRAFDLLGNASCLNDMGKHFGAGLYAREIDFLKRDEWAVTAEDILWRRTKLGLHMSDAERKSVEAYMQ